MSVSGFCRIFKREKQPMILKDGRMQDLSIEIDHFGVEGFM